MEFGAPSKLGFACRLAAAIGAQDPGVRRVILFGSASRMDSGYKDIDIAVEGIPLNRILDADVEVGDILRQPYDLVSREENSRFFEIISRYGKVLYG